MNRDTQPPDDCTEGPRPWGAMHPEVQLGLTCFAFGHLPPHLAIVSKPFCDLAWDLAGQFDGPQLIVALRALRRAKDEAVLCAVDRHHARLTGSTAPTAPAQTADNITREA